MEAYTYLRHNDPPDLLISDIMMPRMDGLTLTNRMKNDDALKLIPVILLTAKGGPRDMITGINAGARHYVTKPFDRETFLGKVKKTLGIR
jgi:CheY-like chemotaxis protein